ncbi:Bug family tripartite tricarboxylate transporter substrate binding protein [Pollutimonas harenae]|uniref:Tripartite tricarboxylate transporter substrate binding protein n=1 Tax=Pollutimonas harenae TaxID=657015 RepID=A0A853GYF7_9BURK|nr:tripartite tricarboxylate transporter substrate binding protein [Pollutimonas harenae]NYT84810.1 tripartite tricarboxylate transporter substrate binding protein [Pollutimonas harenae]TEA72791.1 tripartite tricarboxylate transporter substrate binding protein [Pollutimonas harenae]
MKKLNKWVWAGILAVASASQAWAAYPEKPVTMIIGYPPGQATDIVGRLVAEKLGQRLGQPFVVENKPGQGASLALAQLTKEKPDGYTMVLSATAAYVTNPHLYKSVGYDTLSDFKPIGTLIDFPLVMVARADAPFDDFEGFLKYAKEHPGKLNHTSSGNGTLSHLGMELLQRETGTELIHIPYKGSARAMTDIAAGNVDVGIETVTVTKPFIESGRLKLLGVTVSDRLKLYPNTPTLDELGVKGFNVAAWLGMVFPAGTPDECIKVINDALQAILKDPEVAAQLESVGALPRPSTTKEFAQLLKREYATWGEIVKQSGAKVD